MSQEDIRREIEDFDYQIERLSQDIRQYESIDEQSNDVLEDLEDSYRRMIQLLRKNILNFENLKITTKESFYDEIFNYKEKELDYDEKYIITSERLRGSQNVHFSTYLRLNSKIYDLFLLKRNKIVHHHPQSDINIPEFLNKTVASEYEKMISNLDKAIDSTETELGNLRDNYENYIHFKDLYEILGDLYVHKVLLRSEKQLFLGIIKKESYFNKTDESKKALNFYNIAIDFGRKFEDGDTSYLTYRADNYLEIFKDFMFKDKLGNLKEITDLKEKRNYIEEKFRIWEKYTKNRFSTKPLKGMKDFLPGDLREVNWVLGILKDIADRYSYEEFEAPILEPIEIFAAKSSYELVYEQSFYVEKFEDKKIILRPELTPSLARIVAKKFQELKKPIRWYSIPICFRYEQPQRGRLRSFKQVNFDILGEESLYGDLEIFNIIVDIFNEFGATSKQFQIYYNSRRFMDSLCKLILEISEEELPLVFKILDKSNKMDENEFEKFVIDTFQNEVSIQGILKLKDAKNIGDLLKRFEEIPENFYSSKGYLELIKFERLIKEADISDYCTFSSGTVRGLDYYTGIIYEVFDTGTENIRSIFGGGRYDDLLSLFSDEKITGTGFGMGVLMLSLFLKTYNLIPDWIREKDYTDMIYLASINETVSGYTLELARILRDEDLPCIVDYSFKNLKNQLSRASDLGVSISIIVGPNEMKQKRATIKNMVSEEQKTVDLERLIEEVYNILDEIEDST